ncbi:MAG: hypothetical protein ACM335_07545 [Deltaproteobacteria bacterium]
MEYLFVAVACAAVVGYLLFRKKSRTPAQDTYVCEICGETECLCHKAEKK